MMKANLIFLVLIISVMLSVSTGCTNGMAGIDDSSLIEKNAVIDGTCLVSGTITAEDAKLILFMMDEEKMARDVYIFFSGKYTLPVFRNISKSESIHMKAVGNLVSGFNLTFTGTDTPGEFENSEIAGLYKELTGKGSLSLDEALKAGALIEETDILDLEKAIMQTQNASVKTVFTHLLRASENHLRAFTGILKARKMTYEPLLLSSEYYQAVMSRTTTTVDFDGKRAAKK